MKAPHFDINDLRVASPCHVAWDAMTGNDRVRSCDSCKLNVFNISEMTAAEAKNLILSREGRLCVRFYKRADGTVITKDCPVGFRAYQKRATRFAGAALAGILGLFSISFGQKEVAKGAEVSKAQIIKKIGQETIFTGTVTDPLGAVIPNAQIVVYDQNNLELLRFNSDAFGAFKSTHLRSGVYILGVTSNGFNPYRSEKMEINDNESIDFLILLRVEDTSFMGDFVMVQNDQIPTTLIRDLPLKKLKVKKVKKT